MSEAFLIKSYKLSLPVVPPTEPAEGDVDQGSANVDIFEEVSSVYLVEPLRLTTSVVKFSGTLGSTSHTDMRSLTMSAFAHYVAEKTACLYVFADIQGVEFTFLRSRRLTPDFATLGSNDANAEGKLSLTLFDPMTHTVDG